MCFIDNLNMAYNIILKMFMIVSRHDYPLFEMEIPRLVRLTKDKSTPKDLYEFILNAALDPIEQQ